MFEFVNQESCLKFSSVNGAISGMTAYGKELMTGAERAFRIRLLAGNGDAVMLDDRDFSDFSFDGLIASKTDKESPVLQGLDLSALSEDSWEAF